MKVLIVEDETELASSISQYLGSELATCEVASDYRSALEKTEVYDYDCIVLDISLPGGSGLDILENLKQNGKADGVLIISAKASLDDRIKGLQLGADDYLIKPFHLSELAARVAAIIRRKTFGGATTLSFDMLHINLGEKIVRVEDQVVDLTRKEYDLLLYFIGNKGKVISKGAIAGHLWAEVSDGVANYDFIYTHIKNLRHKLAAKGCPDYIQSIYGMGYKFRLPS